LKTEKVLFRFNYFQLYLELNHESALLLKLNFKAKQLNDFTL